MTAMTDEKRVSELPDEGLWCINITGPDDIIAATSRAEAIELAQRFNTWWIETFASKGLHPYDPTMWAVPITYPNSPDGHADNLKARDAPEAEYRWLFAPARRSQEPDGWRLVPVEPTEAMKKAGFGPFLAAHDPFFNQNEPTGPIYRAMLAAAPIPQSNEATKP